MKKITYNFTINEGGYPSTGINRDFWMLDEIGAFSSEYVREIVKEMEKVRSGERESYDFGYEATGVVVEKGNEMATIEYEYFDKEIEVPFEDIYNLMKDWRDYITEWEKETGKKK